MDDSYGYRYRFPSGFVPDRDYQHSLESPTCFGDAMIYRNAYSAGMARTSTVAKIVAVCRSCQNILPAEETADGNIRPIGVAKDCTCGEGDFRRFDRGSR